ncbi:MAG TPA: 30S ribosomal protein S6 [Kofleriaceae bacterium]|jgi:small subunit ribosomal protein S6
MAQLLSLADAPGTLREYETIYILRPDTQNDKVAEVNTKVKGIIESMGGVVLAVDNWGKRKLAYEIKKELKGIYLYWQYLATPGVVAEFERNMRMLDPVVRYMTIATERDVDPKERQSQVNDETYAKAAATAADEEELMMRRTDESAEGDEFGASDEDDVFPGATPPAPAPAAAAAEPVEAPAPTTDEEKPE